MTKMSPLVLPAPRRGHLVLKLCPSVEVLFLYVS